MQIIQLWVLSYLLRHLQLVCTIRRSYWYGRFQCSSQEQHQMALQLSGLWKPSQTARVQGTESRKRSSSRQTKSPNGLCSFVQEVVSAPKPRIVRPLAEQSKWLHAFRHAFYSAQKTIRHRFSAFWLRSKCSICSYQLNIWYEGHVPSSILNWFLKGDGMSGACSGSITSWPCIAVPQGSAHFPIIALIFYYNIERKLLTIYCVQFFCDWCY